MSARERAAYERAAYALAGLDAIGADLYAPIILPSDGWKIEIVSSWHSEPIGVGVERCPPDPENRWPLGS